MATAEEILRAAADDEEKILIIDNELRTIDIPESVRILGVESDDDVNRLRFSMPRKIGETDLGAFDIQINYINAAGKGDVYFVNDMETGEDTITFSWLVGRFAAQNAGTVHFIVCAKFRQDGEVVKEFNTTTAKLEVLKGIEVGENAEQEYPDVIESILSRLGSLEEGGTGGGSSVELDDTLTQSGKAADAKAVGDAINQKVGTSELNTAVNNALTEAKNSGEFKGDKGDPGNDGYSPTISVRQDEGKAVISIVDADGRKNVTLYDGKTPEKGTDYWTEEDKTEIVQSILEVLPNASGVSF